MIKFLKNIIGKIIDWIYFRHWKLKTLIQYKGIITHDTAMEIWISQNILQREQGFRREELIDRQKKIKETKMFLEFIKNLKKI